MPAQSRSASISRLVMLVACFAAFPSPTVAGDAEDRIRGAAIEAHIRFLADDLLEGREAGTRGYDLAAAYVAAQFAALGLTPGADGGGWFQSVPLRKRTLERVAMSIRSARGSIALENGIDAAVDAGTAATHDAVRAPLVFVGWGISAPAAAMTIMPAATCAARRS